MVCQCAMTENEIISTNFAQQNGWSVERLTELCRRRWMLMLRRNICELLFVTILKTIYNTKSYGRISKHFLLWKFWKKKNECALHNTVVDNSCDNSCIADQWTFARDMESKHLYFVNNFNWMSNWSAFSIERNDFDFFLNIRFVKSNSKNTAECHHLRKRLIIAKHHVWHGRRPGQEHIVIYRQQRCRSIGLANGYCWPAGMSLLFFHSISIEIIIHLSF